MQNNSSDLYGLYCCSGYKANDRITPYAYAGPANEGLMQTLQDAVYLKRAQAQFLAAASTRYGAQYTDMEKAKKLLLQDLWETVHGIGEGLDKAHRFEKVRLHIIEKFKSIKRMVSVYAYYRNRFDAGKKKIKTYQAQLDRLYESWRQRPWWAKIVFIKNGGGERPSSMLRKRIERMH